MSENVRVTSGLAGVTVADTRIGKSDSDGTLIYRGYPIEELTGSATFEEVAYLVTRGNLPKRGELESFSEVLGREAKTQEQLFDVMRELGRTANPIDALRTACSALGCIDAKTGLSEQQASLEAKVPVLAANCLRVPRGDKAVLPRGSRRFAEDLLRMLTQKDPNEFDIWVFERALILYMEHDFNASSFTVRVVASTLADPYAAVTAGLAALKGPLHGGANEAAMDMLLKVGEPERVSSYLDEELEAKRKVPGFGHRIYKRTDPRAQILKGLLKEMLGKRGDDKLYRLCDAMEQQMKERKNLPANLDFYAAPIFYVLGIEIPLYTPIFAASRVFGWMAHYSEQVSENKLIRPDAAYVGPTNLRYFPLSER
jgi:2-methylcitrate synthase